MRKFEQKQLLDLASTIKNLNSKLAQIYQSGNQDIFMEVLESEQTAAISIGTRIDRMIETKSATLSQENKDFLENIVRRLEEYCELLWKASQVESQFQLANSLYVLDTKLSQIIEDLEKIPARYEVVFLPYKASMWDCMETVWRAAVEDPDCDVYVVPIPYYDLDPEGKPEKVHCEIDLMPANIPVVDYRSYSIEERRPDVIYIHNPFDEYNKVTSVHPNYYCSYLKNYTDMLVYIPYFLSSERLSETHSMLPAYVYADKIVLANEKMMDDIDHSIPRDKFIIAGSPKEERMIWMELHKDELLIPQEWKDTIKGRKVVFYNVSISGLLKYREKMLAKMDEVFGIFEKRQDVVLLYRPHPLIETTMSSMCPELLEDYQKLVKRVKSMENAIYDTTSDVGVSVAVADAYIGEGSSSVVQMFRTVQKPIMYLNEEKYYQPTLDEMLSDRISDVCRVGDDLWFVTLSMQMLCRYSIRDNKIKYVASIPDTIIAKYLIIVNYMEKLVMIPYIGNSVCVYDMQEQVFRKDYFKEEKVYVSFSFAFLNGHYLYLTPGNYPAIVRYDILSGVFEYYRECIEEAKRWMSDVGEELVFGAAELYGNELFITSSQTNIIIIFNIEDLSYRIERYGDESNNCLRIVIDNNYCWIVQRDKPEIIRWNRQNGAVKLYSELPKDFVPGEIPYKALLDMYDDLYLIPCHANHICKLSKENGKISYADRDICIDKNVKVSKFFTDTGMHMDMGKKISAIEFVTTSLYDNMLNVYNVEEGTYQNCPLCLEEKLRLEVEKVGASKLQEVHESSSLSLNKYLYYIAKNILEIIPLIGQSKKALKIELKVGEEIHKGICSSLMKK